MVRAAIHVFHGLSSEAYFPREHLLKEQTGMAHSLTDSAHVYSHSARPWRLGLFRKTTSRNKELEARVKELEREIAVWKIAHKAVEDEKNVLNKEVSKLERNIGSLKVWPLSLTCHPVLKVTWAVGG